MSSLSLCTLLSSTSLITDPNGVSGPLQVVTSPSALSPSVVASKPFLCRPSQTSSLDYAISRTTLSVFLSPHPCVASALSTPWASLLQPYVIHRRATPPPVDYRTASCTSGMFPSFHSCYRISVLFRHSRLFFSSSSRKSNPRTDVAVTTAAEGVSDTAAGPAAATAYLLRLHWSFLLPSNCRILNVSNLWPGRHRQVATTSLQAKNFAVEARLVVTNTRRQVIQHALLRTAQELWSRVPRQSRSLRAFGPFLRGGEERKLQEEERQGNVTPFRRRDAANKHNAGQRKGIIVLCSGDRVSQGEHATSPIGTKNTIGTKKTREEGHNQQVNAKNLGRNQEVNPTNTGCLCSLLGTATASGDAAVPNQKKAAGISVQSSHLTRDASLSTKGVAAEKATESAEQPSLVRDVTGSDCFSAASGRSLVGEAISGRRYTLTNRRNIGERRRLDRRLNWFKQYPYAPEHPAASRKRKGIKTTAGNLPSHGVPADKQILPSRPLPHSLRWKVLAETPAPAAAAAAAAAAATQAALDVLESSTISAKRRKSKKRLKKQALARAAVAAAAAAQKVPGSAALVAAARWLQSAQLQKPSAVDSVSSTSSTTGAPTTKAIATSEATTERLSETPAAEVPQPPPSTGAAVPDAARKQEGKDAVAEERRRQTAAVADAKRSTSPMQQADVTRVSLPGQKGVLKQLPLAAENKGNLVGTSQAGNVSGGEEQQCPSLLSLLYPSKHAAYPPQLAVFVMKQLITSKFNESVELHVQLNLGSGPRGKARVSGVTAGRVRGYVTLPHGTFGELAELAKSERQLQQDEEMQISRNQEEEGACELSQDEVSVNQGDASHWKKSQVLSRNAKMAEKEEPEQSTHRSKVTAHQRQHQLKGSTEAYRQQGRQVLEEQMKNTRGVLPVPGGSTVLPAQTAAVLHDGILKEETGIVRGRKKGGVWRRRRIIAAFVDRADEKAAIQAGADVVGVEKILSLIRDDAINFDVLISTPDMVARLTRYGKILGPKNLLPQDAWGTLSADFCGAIRLYRQTTVPYKSDKFNIVHLTIGHASMPTGHLVENLEAAIYALHCSRPPSAGSNFFYKVHISSTMGPGILIDMKHVRLTASGKNIMRG